MCSQGNIKTQQFGNSITLTQQFDVFNRLKQQQLTHPAQTLFDTCTYNYDSINQLIARKNEGVSNQNINFEYNSLGQLIQQTLASSRADTTTHYQWDSFGNPQSQTVQSNTNDAGISGTDTSDTGEQGIEHDAASNEHTASSSIDLTRATHSEYNELAPNGSESSSKNSSNADSVVNNESTNNTTINSATDADRLTHFGDSDFYYDEFGNQIRETGKGIKTRREYNAFNQLSCFNNNGTITQYDYDPLGRRIAKHTEHGKIDYIWDNDQLIGECQNGEYTWYINLPNQFHPVALIKQGQLYYYHLDQLNTPRFVTNNKADVVWENQADVYGYEESEAESDFNKENSFTQPIRFQGQYLDEESGLHYNRYRYYSPKQQRFINQDPIGLVGGINHYQYAPNPVNWVDPFGLSCKENAWNTFQRNTKGHFKNSSEAAASYQAMKGVRKLDNKLRPNVSDYLPQSYIDAHEAKFAGGAAYFTPKWALDEFGRSVVGRPDGQFVMTKTQMDGILTRSSGDMALIEEELGIPAGGWQKNEMVIIEVSDPNKHNVRIPTGREDGANELWLPGGKLPTGHDEAVIDAIPEGSYKELSIAEAVNSTKNAKEKT